MNPVTRFPNVYQRDKEYRLDLLIGRLVPRFNPQKVTPVKKHVFTMDEQKPPSCIKINKEFKGGDRGTNVRKLRD